mgnify:CR=1 FL=1
MLSWRGHQSSDTFRGQGTKSFTLRHQFIKSNGQIAIDGSATSVIMDTTKRLIIPVPVCLAKHLSALS